MSRFTLFKNPIILGLLVILFLIASESFGLTKIGLTLSTGSSVNDGLVFHYTFDNQGPNGITNWYGDDWLYRSQISISPAQVTSTLTDFPIYVDLSDLPTAFFETVQTDGDDIRITDGDGVTELPFELVSINTGTQTGELHFKADLFTGTVNNFYIYYGNASATGYATTDTYGAENVWTKYVGVWHNNEDPSITEIIDSTGNNNGTPNGNMTSDDSVAGRLAGGNALHFDGDDYVDISPDGGVLDIYGTGQTLTLCAWALVEIDDTPTSWPPIFSKGDIQYVLKLNNGGAWEFKTNNAYFLDGNPDLDTWYYLCGRNNGSTNQLFIDSILQGNSSVATSIGNQTHAVYMGRDSQNVARSPYWRGMIDEVRISTESLSSDWIAAEYVNQATPNTFYTASNHTTKMSAALSDGNVVPGRLGQALEFDGVSDKIDLGDSAELNLTIPLSMGAWIKLDSLPSADEPYGIITKWNDSSNDYREWYFILNSDNKLEFRKANGATEYETATATTAFTDANLGEWIHLGFSIDGGGDWTIFINGEEDAIGTFGTLGIGDSIGVPYIGAIDNDTGSSPDYFFDGAIDDVRLYNRALSRAQMKRVYQLGATTNISKTIRTNSVLEEGLVAHLTLDAKDMDFSQAPVAGDSVGSNNGGAMGFSSNGAAWYNENWSERLPLAIQSSQVGSTLTDFPVYVDLSNLPAAFFANVQSDGDDIRITSSNGTTELPYELVSLDASGAPSCATNCTGELHFKASSISSSSDTTFYIYYGNVAATGYAITDTYGAENVWTNGYAGVWHLEETSGVHYDSTANNNDGTNSGSNQNVAGKMGIANDFDKIDDYIDLGSGSGIDNIFAAGGTISAWIEPDGQGENGYGYIVSKATGANDDNGWVFMLDYDRMGFSSSWNTQQGYWDTVSNVNTYNSFSHVVVTYSSTSSANDASMYLNGAAISIKNDYEPAITIQDDAASSARIGNKIASTDRTFDGTIDEVRLSTEIRSADWIAAEYSNQNTPNSFYIIGDVEGVSTAVQRAVVPGRLGQGLRFSGVADYLEIPDDASLDFGTSPFSIGFWFKTDEDFDGTTAVSQTLLARYNSDALNWSITLRGSDYLGDTLAVSPTGSLQVKTESASGSPHYLATTNKSWEANRWYHATVIIGENAATSYIYIDGEADYLAGQDEPATYNDSNLTANWTIGGGEHDSGNLSGARYFRGSLDDIRIYNRALSTQDVRRLYGLGATTHVGKSTSGGSNSLTSGLVSQWTFDGGSGFDMGQDYEVRDSVASNHADHASPSAGEVLPGAMGQALEFDGTADFALTDVDPSLSFGDGDAISLSAWVKPDAVNGSYFILSKGYFFGDTDTNYALAIDGGKLVFLYRDISGAFQTYQSDSAVVEVGEWQQIGVTYVFGDGTSPVLYINGTETQASWQEISTGNVAPKQPHLGLQIGARDYGEYFDGGLDDIRLYNRVLDASEMQRIHALGL